MRLLLVSSKNQLADVFTKALSPRPFNIIISKLGLVNIFQPPACGGVSEEVPNSHLQAHQQEDQAEAHFKT